MIELQIEQANPDREFIRIVTNQRIGGKQFIYATILERIRYKHYIFYLHEAIGMENQFFEGQYVITEPLSGCTLTSAYAQQKYCYEHLRQLLEKFLETGDFENRVNAAVARTELKHLAEQVNIFPLIQ